MKKRYVFPFAMLITMVMVACGGSNEESSEEMDSVEVSESSEAESRPSPLEVKEGQIAGKAFKVQYGSPAVKGRTVWGDLVPYNVVWRTGANEATYVELSEGMNYS